MSRKIAFLGGGGVRTPLVVFGINESAKRLDAEELVLYDVDRERVEMIARLGREVVRRDGGPLRVSVASTPEEAVDGATFVLNSVRVGGIATRAQDECSSIRCGYPGQETTGPGGIAMGQRTIPVAIEYARMVERERSEYQRLLNAVQRLWAKTLPESGTGTQPVYVEGVANLIGVNIDGERLKEMLAALEAKQRLVDLLNAYIDARQQSVRVIFDLEEQAPEMAGLVLIEAPAHMAGEARGTIGVIGSKRMDYENTMNAVSYLSRVFDRIVLHPNG